MKILFLGDIRSNTGPSNVNNNLIKYLPKEVWQVCSNNKIFIMIEIILKTVLSDVIVVSGFSRAYIVSAKISNILNKKVIGILHGCASYEEEINKTKFEKFDIVKEELNYLGSLNLILCVSEKFMFWLKERYPNFANRTSFLYNGIEWDSFEKINKESFKSKKANMIITMGGGRPQKNNLVLCRAIELLNKRGAKKFKLIILGDDEGDTQKIKAFDFVEYKGKISHDEAYSYLIRSHIFIQNSIFEPFGLATIEALLSGCDILLSSNVGALGILKSIEQSDIIDDCNDIVEIADKINILSENPNNSRILESIDRSKTSFKYRAGELYNIALKIGDKNDR